MAKKGRGSSVKNGLEMIGVSDLLKKIEAAGGNINQAVQKAVDRSLEQVGMKMQLFMQEHRLTGETYRSFEQRPAKESKTVKVGKEKYNVKDGVTGIVGYSVKEGGLPAVFLDVGAPNRAPNYTAYYFRYYAIENSRKQIEEIQRATLNEILEGLK